MALVGRARTRCRRAVAPRSTPGSGLGSGGGFTLVEVLVALAMIAVVLSAALGLAGQAARDAVRQRALTEAGWVALDQLAAIRIAEPWPRLGSRLEDAAPAPAGWTVARSVTATASPAVRRIDVAVRAEGSERVLARRSTFAVRPE